MQTGKKLKTVSLDSMIDKHIGKVGTSGRDAFEHELKLDLLGSAIKEARLHHNLTQEQLGQLVGVQKAQISKLENNLVWQKKQKKHRPVLQKNLPRSGARNDHMNLIITDIPE